MFSPDGATRDIASWGRAGCRWKATWNAWPRPAAAATARIRTWKPASTAPTTSPLPAWACQRSPSARAWTSWTVGLKPGALREKYFADCYHQACDAWTPSWDPSGHAADTLLVYDLGAELANSRRWPTWEKESEFRSARDKKRSGPPLRIGIGGCHVIPRRVESTDSRLSRAARVFRCRPSSRLTVDSTDCRLPISGRHYLRRRNSAHAPQPPAASAAR